MDLRPAPSSSAAVAPANRKSVPPTKKKPLCAPKHSRETSAVPARYLQPPKRTFGTVRSANATVETEPRHKPPPPKPPARKPRLVPSNPQDAGKTARAGPTKPPAVGKAPDGQHPRSPSPTLHNPSPAAETPFHSARRCSDCRVERLESSSYWIEQIKLAEFAGKHSVSAAFFRLGFECQAEPLRKLRLELRSYTNRHALVSETWSDIHRLYGMPPAEKEEALDSTSLLGLSSETISPDAGAETHDDCDGCGDCGSEGMQEEDWVTKDDECCDESLEMEKSQMEAGGHVDEEEHGDELQVKDDSNLTSD